MIAQAGGRDNAFTAADYTGYHETVASDRLELLMRLEADRMTGLVLDDSEVRPERDVVLEERRMRVDNEPAALLREQLMATLFLNDSYRVPTIGWESEIQRLGTEDALAFYRQWYAPNNAVLVVTGDVDTDEVRLLAEKYFGPIPPRPLPGAGPPRRAAASRRRAARDEAARAWRSRAGGGCIWRRATGPATRSTPTRCRCWPRSSAAAPGRGSIRIWSSTMVSRSASAPTTRRARSG